MAAVEDVMAELATDLSRLSAADLADLLEKHLWLLPATERMSGTSFLIKQDIEKLRNSQIKN